jgi:hypothetical protein
MRFLGISGNYVVPRVMLCFVTPGDRQEGNVMIRNMRGLRVLPRVFLPHTDDLRFQHIAFKFETFRLHFNLKLSER